MRAALLAAVLAWPGALAQPKLASGRVEAVPAGGSLAQQVRSFAGPTWVGYEIAAVPANRGCCLHINGDVCTMGCSLEGGAFDGSACATGEATTVHLEGERTAYLLMRVNYGEVEKLRVFSPSCQLDAGELTLHWLTNVQSGASISFLKSLTQVNIVNAIGAHRDPAADAFLRETVELTTAPRHDRERAAMILALTRGEAGLAIVKHIFESDADEQFRQQLPAAMYQAPEGAGTMMLIAAATADRNRKVREKAFFWLGRSKDLKAQQFVAEVLAK